MFDPLQFPRSKMLLTTSAGDHRAAVALHGQGMFPQAVFSLQQAVEKAVKAIGLAMRVIAPHELQSAVSHKAINVYVSGLWKLIGSAVARDVTDADLFQQLEHALKGIEADRRRFSDPTKPTEDELVAWISEYRAVRDMLRTGISGPQATAVIGGLREQMKSLPPAAVTPEELALRVIDAIVAVVGLYFLCAATLAHAISARYGNGDKSAEQLYSDVSPIIRNFGDLCAMAGECISIAQASFAFYEALP